MSGGIVTNIAKSYERGYVSEEEGYEIGISSYLSKAG